MDISSQTFKEYENNQAEEYEGLTQEKYEKIIALQQKHDAEIRLLANECQLEIAFVKSIFKDNREPAPKKSRNISSWNAFQSEWFRKNKIKATAPGAQKKCAEEYTLLSETERSYFKQTAEELSKNRIDKEPSLIENINLRKAELNNQICIFRKLYRTLQITCNVEFLTIIVPLDKELNSSYFGTPVGEEFYKTCMKIDEIVDSFHHFSCLKKAAKSEIIKQAEEMSAQVNLQELEDATKNSLKLSIADLNNPNSKKTRDKVRKFIQEKFSLVTREKIIYKNWYQQTKYSVKGWPEGVLFCNYSDLDTEDKKRVLNNLNSIHFQINNLE
ncbi:unnamed protein product [Rhizophagus irregularis]|nr:unnamed protein product [Rhizophagus irregularis]